MAGKLYKVLGSSIHNRGLFAMEPIPAGTDIVEYFGEKITKAESLRRAEAQQKRGKRNGSGQVYIFDLNTRYDLDGFRKNNPARYINHSCDPNCEAENRRGRIWIVSLRDIEAGEELTYDYGFPLEFFLEHPCRCSAPNCCGYIVAATERARLKRMLARKKKPTPGTPAASDLSVGTQQ